LLWNFGDGSTATGTLTPSHTYADNGTYTVTLTVTDDDGGVGTKTEPVTINNVAPTVTARPSLTTDEGTLVDLTGTIFSDPGFGDTHTATVNWGDGTSQAASVVVSNPGGPGVLRQGSVVGSHVYADNGIYNVQVCVTDDDGGQGCGTFTATVNNVAPTVNTLTAVPNPVAEGSSVLFSGTFSDPGSADTHTASWNLGDGNAFNLIPIPAGQRTASRSHTYMDNGTYTARLTITDDDGGSGFRETTVTVFNVPPRFDPPLTDQTVREGSLLSFDVRAVDASPADVLTLTARGLPQGASFAVPAGTSRGSIVGRFSWVPSCTQADVYRVTFRASDDDNGDLEQTITLTVTEACQPVIAVTNANGRSVTLIDGQTNLEIGTLGWGDGPVSPTIWRYIP
jgi:PKD repeat protein